MIIPVVLSGGSGTRLWPLSRELYPKQLLPLTGEQTMLQETLTRLNGLADVGAPVIVCNEHHRFMVAEQLRQLNVEAGALLLEPVGRNTAPAVAAAALSAIDRNDDRSVLLLVLPADHVIRDKKAFHTSVQAASAAALAGHLVTFGIVPDAAETGYGYIRRGKQADANGTWPVEEFVEKPDAATAQKYLDDGGYLWNSGMFLFRADTYLDELGTHAPDILEASRNAFYQAQTDLDFLRLDSEAFAECRSESIDYAVMEPTRRAVVVPLDAGWSDVGTWSSLCAAQDADDDANVLIGDVVAEKTSGCYIYAGSRLVATVGLQEHVVIETSDAVLVAPRDRVHEVKSVVERLRRDGRDEATLHRKVYRPWGAYDSVDTGERFQVKRITVKPGATLSLQMHHHRAEHWIVVSGTAEVTRGDEVFLLTENESTYIPLGTTHRLANPGSLPLELIEVQSGSYLGEDDIVRFEDTYGRAE